MKEYNDTYKAATTELNGETWWLLEMGHHILRNRREELGYTQKQVANLAGITSEQYQKFEYGKRTMMQASLRIGLAICDALELDPHRFTPEVIKKE